MKQHITGFYLESLGLISIFIVIILTLTSVFTRAQQQSIQAAALTNAVCQAETAAEAVGASEDSEELCRLLEQVYPGAVTMTERELDVAYTVSSGKGEEQCIMRVTWETEQTAAGVLTEYTITVYRQQEPSEPIYTLKTAVYGESELL